MLEYLTFAYILINFSAIRSLVDTILFSIGNYNLTLGMLLSAILVVVAAFILFRILALRISKRIYERTTGEPFRSKRLVRILNYIFYLSSFIGLLLVLDLDRTLIPNQTLNVKISTILEAFLIIQIARYLDWMVSKVFIHNYYQKRDQESLNGTTTSKTENEETANKFVLYIVYVLALVLIMRNFNFDYSFPYTNQDGDPMTFRLSNIFVSILYLLVARLITWILTQLVLYPYYKQKKINVGSQFAINQLLKYVIYVIAIVLAIGKLGVETTLIWGGAAALLVGIGLGLQQTFNDFFSGLILLFERSVEVGDVLDIGGMVGTVKEIGLRASLVETRDNVSVIVPNSKLVVDSVTNWTHYHDLVRFNLKIGVDYASDTSVVKKILLDVAEDSVYILKYPAPFVRFTDFAESSLNFELFFWSKNYLVVEDIKSDLRFEINTLFKENEIKIPYPQREIWSQSAD